jgi:hypothetical protein
MLADCAGNTAREDRLTIGQVRSELRKNVADAANDVIAGLLVRGELDKTYGNVLIARTKYQGVVIEFQEAEVQRFRGMHGINGRRLRAIERDRIVVAIDNGNEVLTKQWLHGGGLQAVDSNGDEALPEASAGAGTLPGEMEDGIGNFNHVNNFRGLDARA